jgi:hypothetical protein
VHNHKKCTFCGKAGHLAIAGPTGCYKMSQNAKYRPRWYLDVLEGKGTKRPGPNTANSDSATKKRKIEEGDFVQGSTSD